MSQFFSNPIVLWTFGGLIIAGLLVMVGVGFYQTWKYQHDRPTDWTMYGEEAPEALWTALDIIYSSRPNPTKQIRWGGRITWVKEAIKLIDGGLAAGVFTDENIPTFTIQRVEPIWQTALVHELGHYLWKNTYGSIGEEDGKPSWPFLTWVNAVNGQIKTVLTQKAG